MTCVPWQADHSCDPEWSGLPPDLQVRADTLAWSTIRALSGGRVGSCPVTIRPCLTDIPCGSCMGHAAPLIAPDGHWYYPGSHSDGCSCCTVCEILMPGTVARIEAVELSGMALDPTFFRIDNGNRMVWENSKCCFPHCQDMGKKLGDVGTFGITYTPGVVPKEDGLWAAGVLASEFAKACVGGACRLPSSVTSVARQGVSMELASGMFDNGTGIREVDAYLYSVNPNGLKTAPKVWSPDLVRSKHRMSS